MATNGDLWDAAAFRNDVERAVLGFVDQRSAWLADLGNDAVRLIASARESVIGGKRLRAAFCWWGHLAIAPPSDEAALLRACGSLELLHASALVHDDFMDGSDVRRGRPSTHRRLRSAPLQAEVDRTPASTALRQPSCSVTSSWPGPTRCCARAGCPASGSTPRWATSTSPAPKSSPVSSSTFPLRLGNLRRRRGDEGLAL